MVAFDKYTVIKGWCEDDFSLICNLFFKKHCIFMKSHHHLPYYFEELCIFMSSRLCLPYLFGEHWIFLRSRLCLPSYFGEHCIFIRSFQCLLFYFGKHCIFWEVANADRWHYSLKLCFNWMLCMIRFNHLINLKMAVNICKLRYFYSC